MADLKYPVELVPNLQKLLDVKEQLRAKLGADAGATLEQLVEMAGSGGGGESEAYIINATANGSTITSHDGDYATAVDYFFAGKPVMVSTGSASYMAFTHESQYKRLYFSPCSSKSDSDPDLICLSLASTGSLDTVNRYLLPQWPTANVKPADVVAGKTYYTAQGKLKTGTHVCPEASGGIDGVSFTATYTEHDCDYETAMAAHTAGKPVVIYYGSASEVYNLFRIDMDGNMWFAQQIDALNNKVPLLKLTSANELTTTTGRYIEPGTTITATHEHVLAGKTALGANGEKFTGVLEAYKLSSGTYTGITQTTEKTVTQGSKIISVTVEATAGGNLYTGGAATEGNWVKLSPISYSATAKNSIFSISGNTVTFDIRGTDVWTEFKYFIIYQD